MDQPKTSSTTDTTQDTGTQTKDYKKVVGLVFLILSIVAGGFAYFYMDLTWDLICKNELIFKLCSALAALFFGSLALVLNCKLLLAFTVALLTTTVTLNEKLFSVSNFISESEQKYTLLATFATEFLIATLLCMLFPIIQKILLKE